MPTIRYTRSDLRPFSPIGVRPIRAVTRPSDSDKLSARDAHLVDKDEDVAFDAEECRAVFTDELLDEIFPESLPESLEEFEYDGWVVVG